MRRVGGGDDGEGEEDLDSEINARGLKCTKSGDKLTLHVFTVQTGGAICQAPEISGCGRQWPGRLKCSPVSYGTVYVYPGE